MHRSVPSLGYCTVRRRFWSAIPSAAASVDAGSDTELESLLYCMPDGIFAPVDNAHSVSVAILTAC
jgi:hypothetical protein